MYIFVITNHVHNFHTWENDALFIQEKRSENFKAKGSLLSIYSMLTFWLETFINTVLIFKEEGSLGFRNSEWKEWIKKKEKKEKMSENNFP